jgi:XTP/dITP diphosphohydrolase
MILVLASANRDKRREWEALFALPGLELRGLDAFADVSAPEETGATLEENALLKARAALRATGHAALADDTGLEVEALGGEPGVRAARYAGPGATYDDNVRKLLGALDGVPREKRHARFGTVCALCLPDGVEIVTSGALHGHITAAPRGGRGFGYDPVFEVADLGRTLAELSDEEKNAISHRGRAARSMAPLLAAVLRDPAA